MKRIYCKLCKRRHNVKWTFFGPWSRCPKRFDGKSVHMAVDDRTWTKVTWPKQQHGS
jgi:hypothetical protein